MFTLHSLISKEPHYDPRHCQENYGFIGRFSEEDCGEDGCIGERLSHHDCLRGIRDAGGDNYDPVYCECRTNMRGPEVAYFDANVISSGYMCDFCNQNGC